MKRFLGSKGQHEKTINEIHHEALNTILQEVYGDMENILSDGDGTVALFSSLGISFTDDGCSRWTLDCCITLTGSSRIA